MNAHVLALTLALALVVALPPAATAAPAHPAAATTDTLRLDLDGAVKLALAQGPEARIAQAGVASTNGQVRQALAEALPQITGSLTYDHRFASVFQGLASDSLFGPLFAHSSFAAIHNWTADLTASQLLWSGGRVGAGLAAAKAVHRSAAATRDEAFSDIALTTRTAYLEAAYARAVERIAEEGLAQARAHLAQVKLMRGEGSRSEYDLLQAQVDAANEEPAVVSARNAAEQALLTLRRLLAVPMTQPLALTTPLAFEDGHVPVVDAESIDGAKRPAIASAEAMVVARTQAVRAEQAGRWPKLTASATISHQAFPTDWYPKRHDFVAAVDGAVRLEWPLFQGFRTFGAVDVAKANLHQAEAERDRQLESVALDVAQAREEAQRTLATLAARRGTAGLAQRAHHLATVRWQNGLSTQLEVSDARLQMQTAEVNEIAAVKDYRLALLRLERACGHPLATHTTSIDDLPSTFPHEGDE